MIDPAGEIVARADVVIALSCEPGQAQIAERAFEAPRLSIQVKWNHGGMRDERSRVRVTQSLGEAPEDADLALEHRVAERSGGKLVPRARLREERILACAADRGVEQAVADRTARIRIRQERLVVRELLLAVGERDAEPVAQQVPARAQEKIAQVLEPHRAPLLSRRRERRLE